MTRDLIIAVFEQCMNEFGARVLRDLKTFHNELVQEHQQFIEILQAENSVLQAKLDEAKRVLAAMDNRRQALFNTAQRDLAERLQ